MKTLLGIPLDDTEKDTLLQHFMEQARLSALTYCNVDTLSELYDGTICDLAVFLYQNRDNVGYTTKQQGERSVSYENADIPNSIKTALPLPKVRVMGNVL